MYVVDKTSRVALAPAAGSTANVIGRGNYTTILNYRDGYLETTDPNLAGMLAFGAACVGVATLLRALRE